MRQNNVVKQPKSFITLKRYFLPARVVNLCFLIVMVCSTILTWREVIVLQGAYVASQRSELENVSNALDMQMQSGVDRLLFFRNGMQAALQTPLGFKVLNNVQQEFELRRTQPQWEIGIDNARTLPIYGVSDYFVNQSNLLNRDDERLPDELTAAMELGYLFRLSANASMLPRQAYYVSRAGFYLSTNPVENESQIIPTYSRLLMRPWFREHQQQENRARGVRWYTDQARQGNVTRGFVAASVPLDYQRYWYGVLVLSFPLSDINRLLVKAREDQDGGQYLLYDSRFNLLTSTLMEQGAVPGFSAKERNQLLGDMERDTIGGLHLGTRYVSWQKLRQFGGILVRIHTLREGISGDFGRISIALSLLWLLFTGMLLFSWGIIRRMVNNMYSMQNTLQWQAWFDPLTRLYNRGSFFERAKTLSAQARVENLPFAVIQLDLDHFKSVNDRFGHQAGDLVLSHAAGIISNTIGGQDIAGRVGGEEFCILLPGSTLEQAARVAELIRARIRGKEILVQKDTTLRITVSLGVSNASENGDYDFESLQSVADSRLYRAKNNGRDQVCSTDGAPKK
ncbi:cellulose biosynthesis regulator diguanylate cyclase DgcQ [Kosakonia radicincitans]|uniref:cellulose biosynthesis regulator diguanylate cyclase DgcQ n=1 Tax=Kosakonia radicincitans TaxID=283686 RepID=UPI0005C2DB12|nr:cellulose biosynthesis regulator diguanylate cyclase DgcQ [Kosakonia radicincitans]KIS45132.1 diguanylate cyclase domain protein [Kosakonia radicincitans YD4]